MLLLGLLPILNLLKGSSVKVLEHGAMVYCSTGFEEWMPAGESRCPLCGKNILNPRFDAFFDHILNYSY